MRFLDKCNITFEVFKILKYSGTFDRSIFILYVPINEFYSGPLKIKVYTSRCQQSMCWCFFPLHTVDIFEPKRQQSRLSTEMFSTSPRFQQRSRMDHAAVQSPLTWRPFSCLQDATSRLLPYHTCAGHLPNQQHFTAGALAWCHGEPNRTEGATRCTPLLVCVCVHAYEHI